MARRKITLEDRQRLERARKIKKKTKNSKPGRDVEGKVTTLKGDGLCAICDDGGDLVCCDGGCQRSFHLNQPKCRLILGLTEEQAKIIADKEEYICKNCKYKQHQCFACGKLGSSDLSSEVEVFQCRHDDCARFYHPKCVAELLCPDKVEALLVERQISDGEGFKCPLHECSVCKGGENKDDKNMQFAVCRRCPTTYHRKCLPSDITMEEGPNGQMQRAWDKYEEPDGGIIHLDPILIYCTKHEIIEKLGTPKMNHIIFPKTIREPKVLVGPPTEEDTPEEEEVPDHPSPEQSQPPPIKADTPEETEVTDQPSPEPSQPPLIEEDTPEEQKVPHHPSPEPSQTPSAATDQNQCLCSCPLDSFAPSSLFPHPHPGTGGWLGD